MAQYRKKPVTIEARQFDGDNHYAIEEWINGCGSSASVEYAEVSRAYSVLIHTLEGEMTTSPGDWIIRGIQGEFYPCKPDIFEATYELVEDER